jgi:hypothetical protein
MFGAQIRATVFSSEVYFFTLFTFLYERMWSLGSHLDTSKARVLAKEQTRQCLDDASTRFRVQDVPSEVLDAVQRASSDLGRRRTRLNYLLTFCN